MTPRADLVAWLLEGDPAIRWQTRRDLLSAPASEWEQDQRCVASEGWGARLLAERSPSGRWTRGLYTPKWTSTTYTLAELRRLGLPHDHPEGAESAQLLVDEQVWLFGSDDFFESCVAGITLATAAWFSVRGDAVDAHVDALVDALLDEQMADGGWNCRRPRGATHSSFHTTINVLEGLREYVTDRRELRRDGSGSGGDGEGHLQGESEPELGGASEADADSSATRRVHRVLKAEAAAREFFAQHQLYRSHRTGKVVDPRMARLPFPPRWHHDNLRTLDYFRAAGAPPDPRLSDPIDGLLKRRLDDGRWPLQAGYKGKVWFEMEAVGEPSRWNTLRALRVLDWWGH